VVNLQGDEPFAPASGIRAAVATLVSSQAEMATLATPVHDAATLFDPNAVKLVRAAGGDALYFSRAPVPWPRDAFARDRDALPEGGHWLRHIGLYAYRAGFLRRFAAMPPGALEQVESLEQLRVLEAGFRIAVALAPEEFPPGIDTPEDLARAEAMLRAMAGR
jgi:3-deoxy-manno-octulosonate cytidylyltransferase (CMP-KDO synthetase)